MIFVGGYRQKHWSLTFLVWKLRSDGSQKTSYFYRKYYRLQGVFEKKIVEIRWVEVEIYEFSCWKRNRTIRAQFTHILKSTFLLQLYIYSFIQNLILYRMIYDLTFKSERYPIIYHQILPVAHHLYRSYVNHNWFHIKI